MCSCNRQQESAGVPTNEEFDDHRIRLLLLIRETGEILFMAGCTALLASLVASFTSGGHSEAAATVGEHSTGGLAKLGIEPAVDEWIVTTRADREPVDQIVR